MNSDSEPSKVTPIKVAIALMPPLLIVSICVALYLGVKASKEPVSTPIAGVVTAKEMSFLLRNLHESIGKRGFADEEGQKGLRQTAAMIQGTLGPENYGYEIKKTQKDPSGGRLWPTIWIDIEGADNRSNSEKPLIIAVPYGGGGTGVGFALGFAKFVTTNSIPGPVRLVFYPPLVEGNLVNWVSNRCQADQENSFRGFIQVTGEGPITGLIEIAPTSDHRAELEKVAAKTSGLGLISVADQDQRFVTIKIGERGDDSRFDHGRRLIAAMDSVKKILDLLDR